MSADPGGAASAASPAKASALAASGPDAHGLLDARTRRVLRFGLGVTLGTGLAYLIGFELPFLVPILLGMLLGPPGAPPKLRASIAFVAVIAVACAVGVLLANFLLPFRAIFLLIEFLVLYRIFYALAGGASPLQMVWLLIASLIIPLMGLASVALSVGVAMGLVLGAAIAVGTAWLTHGLIPDPLDPAGTQKSGGSAGKPGTPAKQAPPPAARAAYARRSVTVVFPVLVVFFLFGLTSHAVILVFIALLSLTPNFAAGWKTGKSMITGNLIGGAVAIAVYELLTVYPSFTILLLLTLAVGLVFADVIYSDRPIAPLFKTAWSAVALLVGMSVLSTADASSKFYLRIAQIMAAVIYVAAAFGFLEYLQRKRTKSA
jgi:hypothetical protein